MRKDAALKERVTSAIAKQADYILSSEPVNTANHFNRRKWAMDALMSPEVFADRMMWMVTGNGTIQAAWVTSSDQEDIVDNDIIYVVNVSIDSFARGI